MPVHVGTNSADPLLGAERADGVQPGGEDPGGPRRLERIFGNGKGPPPRIVVKIPLFNGKFFICLESPDTEK